MCSERAHDPDRDAPCEAAARKGVATTPAVAAAIDVAFKRPLDLATPALDNANQPPALVRVDAKVGWGESSKRRQRLDESGRVEPRVLTLSQHVNGVGSSAR